MQNSNVKDTYFQPKNSIRLGDKLMDLSTPKVMGILNVTPDSFYSKSRVIQLDQIIDRASQMLLEGADILDIGGYSSRPGAQDISIAEEVNRIVPAISAIVKKHPDAVISVDTFRSQVAQDAINAGAKIVNDISGGRIDSEIIHVVARNKVPYIIMHMRGTPQTMTQQNQYSNLFNEVIAELSAQIKIAINAGIHDIIIDPGFGFAKDIDQNYELFNNLGSFKVLPYPLLVGISRKSMIYKKLGISPEESLDGTIELNRIALNNGAKILRVHDVKEAVELVKLLS